MYNQFKHLKDKLKCLLFSIKTPYFESYIVEPSLVHWYVLHCFAFDLLIHITTKGIYKIWFGHT